VFIFHYSYQVDVESITPLTGPITGGTLLQVNGKGFGETIDDVSVSIGNSDTACHVMEVTSSYVKCLTPALTAGVADVKVICDFFFRQCLRFVHFYKMFSGWSANFPFFRNNFQIYSFILKYLI